MSSSRVQLSQSGLIQNSWSYTLRRRCTETSASSAGLIAGNTVGITLARMLIASLKPRTVGGTTNTAELVAGTTGGGESRE